MDAACQAWVGVTVTKSNKAIVIGLRATLSQLLHSLCVTASIAGGSVRGRPLGVHMSRKSSGGFCDSLVWSH
jgi:hypothetical protein